MMNLTKTDLHILKALTKEFISIDELSKQINVNTDSIRRAIELLKNDGFIEVKTETAKKYILAEFGKKYLKEDFPEDALAKALKKEKTIAELQKELGQNSGIYLGVGKAQNLIEIKDGKVKLKEKIDTNYFERLRKSLKDIEEGKTVKNINDLKKMKKIIEEQDKSIILIRATVKTDEIKNTEIKIETREITQDMLKDKSWKNLKFKEYNVDAGVEPNYTGKYQPYKRFLDLIRKRLISSGFEEINNSLITTEFYNFDVLFQPQNHPARTWTDTYSLKVPNTGKLPNKIIVDKVKNAHENGGDTESIGWRYNWDPSIAMRLMPAAHGTAASGRKMTEGVNVPGRYFTLARVYRPDVLDATHLNEFNQLEGFVVAKDISFKHLLGLLAKFAKEIAGAEEIMFYPDYYPFTEPSVQLSAKHPQLGWVELGGAGMFRPEITEPLGIKERIIAWGLGIDRLAMFNLGLKDIRDLFTQKIDWLREKPIVEKI